MNSLPTLLRMRPPGRRSVYDDTERAILDLSAHDAALALFKGCPAHSATPLHRLPDLALSLGVRHIYVKEEGRRFGLKSFKALGGAYAVARALQRRFGDVPVVHPDTQVNPRVRETIFCCASDGNHGRSVAFGALHFGAKAKVYVHAGVSSARQEAIRELGAEVHVVDGHYDDSVRVAQQQASAHGWCLIADTAGPEGEWPLPTLDVMRGYSVLASEACDQAESSTLNADACPFTHVFVQAGVGGLAAAVAGYLAERYNADAPALVVVEPEAAACLMASALAGSAASVGGDLETLMAMLSCGEASVPAWEILGRHADVFMTVGDEEAAQAVRRFAQPMGNDVELDVGESGAAGLAALMRVSKSKSSIETVGLSSTSSVLLIATEAPTDPETFLRLVGRLPR